MEKTNYTLYEYTPFFYDTEVAVKKRLFCFVEKNKSWMKIYPDAKRK